MPDPQSLAQRLACLLVAIAVGGCALPRGGPSYAEITRPGPKSYGFHVLPLSPRIVRATRINEQKGFRITFVKTPAEAVWRIARGDILAITTWENADEGLLNPTGIGASKLPKMKVDERGRIFVPYVGLVRAAGRTLNELRSEIARRMAGKTVDPQIDIFPVKATGRSISVQGVVSAPGIYPIDPATTRILPMIARAGGIKLDAQIVRLKIRRGRIQGEIWLSELYDEPKNNVNLRAGDAIIVERDRRIFTALGAVGKSSTVQFPTRDVSVIRAVGTVGGLNDQRADPTGVFLFRVEPAAIARRLFPGRRITTPQRVVYVIDLTRPAAMFLARDFMMRDRDVIYVTNAPYVRWMKVLQAVSPLVNFSASVRTLGGF